MANSNEQTKETVDPVIEMEDHADADARAAERERFIASYEKLGEARAAIPPDRVAQINTNVANSERFIAAGRGASLATAS
jgi:hypothetical protein